MSGVVSLPGPVASLWEWQFEGACRDTDGAVFYHPEGERGAARQAREAAAKAVCARCPVVSACRAHALASGEPFGIWGGLSAEERRRVTTVQAATAV